MPIKLYVGVPVIVGIFIASNFSTVGDEPCTPESFSTTHYSTGTISIALVSETRIRAAAILKFYPKQDGPWVSYFIVEEHFRRKALGTQLMNGIKCMFPTVRLGCWDENREALEFYRTQQFKRFGGENGSTYLVWERAQEARA